MKSYLVLISILYSTISYCQIYKPKIDPINNHYGQFISSNFSENAKRIEVISSNIESNWSEFKSIYFIDRNGRVIKFLNKNNEIIFQYNNSGYTSEVIRNNDTTFIKYEFTSNDKISNIQTYKQNTIEKTDFEYDEKLRLTKIVINSIVYKVYEYFDNDSIKKITEFRDSTPYETREFTYVNFDSTDYFSYLEIEKRTLISENFEPLPEYYYFYFDKKNRLTKTVEKYDIEENEIAITSIRYNKEGNIISISDFIANNSSSGYSDFIYDKKGNFIKTIAFSNNGELKTRETTIKYKFY